MSADNQQNDLAAIERKQLQGTEHFRHAGSELPQTVGAFWRWAYSNLAANNLRGHLAEFIVASDLGVTQNGRIEWDDYDLITQSGLKVEVKSAAYLQSWNQGQFSAISFGISPSFRTTKANPRADTPIRKADVYVFCLLAQQIKRDLDPTNLDQWKFFVIQTRQLEIRGTQKTLSLNALLRLNPVECEYGKIGVTIKKIFDRR